MSAQIIRGMTAAEYHAIDALSASELKAAHDSGVSWLHWRATRETRTETPAMRLGSLAHLAILEPEAFARCVLAPEVNARTNEGKATLAAFVAQCAADGLTPVNPDEHAAACGMRDAVHSAIAIEPVTFGAWLPLADRELTILWTGADDVPRKARLDAYHAGAIVDLKTTRDASQRAFVRTVSDFAYHVQAAHYRSACEAAGLPFTGFVFVAVESSAPHNVGVYQLGADTLDAGARACARALGTIHEARNGRASSYTHGIVTIDVPWLTGER